MRCTNLCVWNFRSKFHKLKYGTDLDLGDMTPPSFDKDAKGLQLIYYCIGNRIWINFGLCFTLYVLTFALLTKSLIKSLYDLPRDICTLPHPELFDPTHLSDVLARPGPFWLPYSVSVLTILELADVIWNWSHLTGVHIIVTLICQCLNAPVGWTCEGSVMFHSALFSSNFYMNRLSLYIYYTSINYK